MGRETGPKKPTQSRLTKPALLKAGHILDNFECDRPKLADWLKKHALKAMEGNTARTYVVCRGGKKVVAYYALAAGAVDHASSPRALRQNAPDPIPVIILARLARDSSERGNGLGVALVADAMKRAAQAARIIGARAVLVHALDERAAGFYSELEFKRLAKDTDTFYMPMKTIFDAL